MDRETPVMTTAAAVAGEENYPETLNEILSLMPFIRRSFKRRGRSATFTILADLIDGYPRRQASEIGAAAIVRLADTPLSATAMRTAEAMR